MQKQVIFKRGSYQYRLTTKCVLEIHVEATFELGDNPSYPNEYWMTQWTIISVVLNGNTLLEGTADSNLDEVIEEAIENDWIHFRDGD